MDLFTQYMSLQQSHADTMAKQAYWVEEKEIRKLMLAAVNNPLFEWIKQRLIEEWDEDNFVFHEDEKQSTKIKKTIKLTTMKQNMAWFANVITIMVCFEAIDDNFHISFIWDKSLRSLTLNGYTTLKLYHLPRITLNKTFNIKNENFNDEIKQKLKNKIKALTLKYGKSEGMIS